MLRLKYLIQFANTENPTWDYAPVGYWSTLEVHLGIIFACLPALRALQHRLFPTTKKGTSYYNSNPYAYGYDSKGGSGMPSISAKFSRRKSQQNTHTTSRASMMRSHHDRTGSTQEIIPLEDYENRLFPEPSPAEIGRGVNETQIQRGSRHSNDDGTFLDTSSIPEKQTTPLDAITVKKEYSVEVAYAPESVSSSPPRQSLERVVSQPSTSHQNYSRR
jgi:hypothetical protein